jgi:RNA polymerase sigma factor (sigma-70 family)
VIRDGFVSFFRERFGRTVVLLVATGASRADAEDAVQEAMILAWRQWDTLQDPAAWVRAVAIRTYWKLARARQKTALMDEFAPEAIVDADLTVFTEEQQHVLRVLRNLPPQQRTIVALSYDGLTYEEIADLLGKSSSTVRSHMRYARNTLKEAMTSRVV